MFSGGFALDQAKKRFCVEVDAADNATLRTAGDKRWLAFARKMVLPQILNIATISKGKVFLLKIRRSQGIYTLLDSSQLYFRAALLVAPPECPPHHEQKTKKKIDDRDTHNNK